MTISFMSMTKKYIALWQQWIEKEHVKKVWLIDGETADYIYKKILGNGYDYPFIIFSDNQPIGYIVACDLYAYRTLSSDPKGLFTHETPGTFCMDLFIGEEGYLDKGFGTQIVRSFIGYIFQHFQCQTILIDPAISNKRAIRCYEKAGFKFVKEEFDGVTHSYIMKIRTNK